MNFQIHRAFHQAEQIFRNIPSVIQKNSERDKNDDWIFEIDLLDGYHSVRFSIRVSIYSTTFVLYLDDGNPLEI